MYKEHMDVHTQVGDRSSSLGLEIRGHNKVEKAKRTILNDVSYDFTECLNPDSSQQSSGTGMALDNW